ncbi:PhzF family phenazine biosynthesis protein [Microbacterium sp. 18062]|uniref:PhzF family phenazine biosynthesis protein n=1 Tax=Microbacterium sp. 18062 TaxID=2681410 RepID=UPI0013582E28|nr:PhzF family phenazine biosynthesis protein [Microbacterium sp. 18062]
MPTPVRFHFVDVFADAPLHGNPLALVEDADALDVETMRAIAREFNQSETTFVLSPTDAAATVRLRSFTPNGSEVFGAGHNALGAWLWLVENRLGDVAPPTGFVQQIGDDLLAVDVRRGADGGAVVSMTQSTPVYGAEVADRRRLAAALGLDVRALRTDLAPQVVSTGAGHLLVPLVDREAVDAVAPDAAQLTAILEQAGGEGCYLYALDPAAPDAVAYARFVNPIMGISEDPATGTAAGPLAALLVAHGHVPDGATAIIEQGFALGRPSRIRVTVAGDDVRVSGSGLMVADGTLFL